MIKLTKKYGVNMIQKIFGITIKISDNKILMLFIFLIFRSVCMDALLFISNIWGDYVVFLVHEQLLITES
jgi:tricorn protease-like protein